MIPDSSQSSLRTFLVYILFAAAGFPPPTTAVTTPRQAVFCVKPRADREAGSYFDLGTFSD
jgi:hypothetical protein